MTTNNHTFPTTDTALATYLLCEGFTLNLIDYSEHPRYQFIFDDPDSKIPEFARLYLTGQARVDPSTFHRINRKLVSAIKNQYQWLGV